ncbi:Serine carboxypeptidase-like, partial [Thalictrum thalictroides]
HFTIASGTKDGSQQWGYVNVRPKAHMFWWLYKSPYRVENPTNPWPILLWLQGGPGASGVGIGNFQEVGPLDTKLKPRNFTWLRKADLLFVDNPVGTGYSFVEDNKALMVKTDEDAATDLTILLKELFNKNENLQNSPLHIVAESYGGKFAVTLGLSVLKAIEVGELKLKLGGVALGDSWISPEDFVFSWGPLLKDVSRLDDNGVVKSNSLAEKVKKELQDGQYVNATNSWSELQDVIRENSNSVDFYNFLLDSASYSSSTSLESSKEIAMKRYSRYLASMTSSPGGDDDYDLEILMNGVIKKQLKIIPKNVTWRVQSELVTSGLEGEFMKPRIKEVDELLAKGVNVTVYNGQFLLLLFRWEGLKIFLSLERTPLACGDQTTRGFTKSYKNLHFYWILGAGHFVPVDQPCLALKMVGDITHSPSISSP